MKCSRACDSYNTNSFQTLSASPGNINRGVKTIPLQIWRQRRVSLKKQCLIWDSVDKKAILWRSWRRASQRECAINTKILRLDMITEQNKWKRDWQNIDDGRKVIRKYCFYSKHDRKLFWEFEADEWCELVWGVHNEFQHWKGWNKHKLLCLTKCM